MLIGRTVQRLALLALAWTLVSAHLSAQATIIFLADDQGNVGRYDVGTQQGAALGSLSASQFTPDQVIGLAYDADTNSVLLFDRNVSTVYTMNAVTGVASVLFTTQGVQLQGGAVFNGLVYGIDEYTQTLKAYDFAGVPQTLTGTALSAHVHSLAVDPQGVRLVYHASSSGLRVINPDGTEGDVIQSMTTTGSEDIDYFNGDYLLVNYGRQAYLLDVETGATSFFLDSTQLSAMGLTGSMSGVAVQIAAVPEPATWVLLLTGLAVVAVTIVRQRRRP